MRISVIDPDKAKCNALAREAALATTIIPVTFVVEEITDDKKIQKFNPPETPAIAINGKIKATGKYFTKEEIKKMLKEEFEASRK